MHAYFLDQWKSNSFCIQNKEFTPFFLTGNHYIVWIVSWWKLYSEGNWLLLWCRPLTIVIIMFSCICTTTFGNFSPSLFKIAQGNLYLHLLGSLWTLTLVYLSKLIQMFVKCKTKTFVDIYFVSVFTQWMLPLERPPFSLQHITILSWVCQVCQIKQWMVILILNLEMEAVHILSQAMEAGGELTWVQIMFQSLTYS